MAPPPHQRITFTGLFGSVAAPLEAWQFNLNTVASKWLEASLVTGATDCAALWATHLAPLHANFIHLTKVRVATVDASGHVTKNGSGGYLQGDWTGDNVGSGVQSSILPPQCAVVASLITARAGAQGKGRVFLPQTRFSVSSGDLRMQQADATTIANSFKAFINAINAAGGGLGGVVVASGGTKAGGAPVLSPVTGIRVGRAVDTHRSRRGDLPEGYVTLAL